MVERATRDRKTESRHPASIGLDARPPLHMLDAMLSGQLQAVESVALCRLAIERAATRLAECIERGGRLIYAGAGSSAFMAMAESLELPGTFGIDASQIKLLMAGDLHTLSRLTGASEDDCQQATKDCADTQISARDCVISLSASGSTPYTLQVQRLAVQRGATTIAIANTAASPLLTEADIPIHLDTPEELIAGSTRMGAATAQKITLNTLSTLMASMLGHVYDGYMVNVYSDNTKLRERAQRMVAAIAGCSKANALQYLVRSDWNVKVAVLLGRGVADVAAAIDLLSRYNGYLRLAMDSINAGASRTKR